VLTRGIHWQRTLSIIQRGLTLTSRGSSKHSSTERLSYRLVSLNDLRVLNNNSNVVMQMCTYQGIYDKSELGTRTNPPFSISPLPASKYDRIHHPGRASIGT
jgi:hypothetical protein